MLAEDKKKKKKRNFDTRQPPNYTKTIVFMPSLSPFFYFLFIWNHSIYKLTISGIIQYLKLKMKCRISFSHVFGVCKMSK